MYDLQMLFLCGVLYHIYRIYDSEAIMWFHIADQVEASDDQKKESEFKA